MSRRGRITAIRGSRSHSGLRFGPAARRLWLWTLLSVNFGGVAPSRAFTTEPTSLPREVSEIFAKHCVSCHGERVKKGGLDVRELPALLQGGESGEPAVTPGKSGESRLIALAASKEMPPGKREKLTGPQLDTLRKWIDSGAGSRTSTTNGPSAGPSAAKVALEVSDLLDFKCWDCHGRGRHKAGLDLSTAAGAIRGGKSGPAVVPGKGSASLLVKKVRGDQMPTRQGRDELSIKPVTSKEMELLETWINLGAPDFPSRPVLKSSGSSLSDEDRQWWSFRPPARPEVPKVGDSRLVSNPIDAFLLARLEKAALSFSPEADRRTLIRRLSVDLIGLTPTPEEVRAFEQDQRPDAYERLVDRLLASPRYGERWGQHWLDAAGYSESDGGDGGDPIRPEFYRYRDYVIRSLNSDKPYDRFITEQVAGDELADYLRSPRLTDELKDNLVATGFLRTCVDPTDRPVHNFLPDRYQVLADTVSIVGSSLMGLTIGCARCHSHKYDPISHAEYYQFSAIFGAAFAPSAWKRPKDRLLPLVSPRERLEIQSQNESLDRRLRPLKSELVSLTASFRARGLQQRLSAVEPGLRAELQAALALPAAKRSRAQKELLDRHAAVVDVKDDELLRLFPQYREAVSALKTRIARLETQRTVLPVARVLTEAGPQPPAFHLLKRGEAHLRGDEALPAVPAVLVEEGSEAGLSVEPPWPGAPTTGRRLALARWLTEPRNPLTARVIVNRVWQGHLGTGLVSTPENFGRTGAKPTHPELLDWLAVEFMDRGWSLKQLHRLIVTSRAYRQTSGRNPLGMSVDPENSLWWRVPLRRLDAEVIRDSIMATAGRLNGRMYGPASEVTGDLEGQVETKASFEHARRSVYMLHQRSKPLTVLDVFDTPRMTINCIQRRTSTVATQALLMLNSAWIGGQCERLAGRVLHELSRDASPRERVEHLVRLSLAREATSAERTRFISFLNDQAQTYQGEAGVTREAASRRALADLALTLLNSPEFLYAD